MWHLYHGIPPKLMYSFNKQWMVHHTGPWAQGENLFFYSMSWETNKEF